MTSQILQMIVVETKRRQSFPHEALSRSSTVIVLEEVMCRSYCPERAVELQIALRTAAPDEDFSKKSHQHPCHWPPSLSYLQAILPPAVM